MTSAQHLEEFPDHSPISSSIKDVEKWFVCSTTDCKQWGGQLPKEVADQYGIEVNPS